MRETIQRLIEAEDAAKRRVQAARQEADQILAAARTHASALVAEARARAALDHAALVEAACNQARLDRERLLAETACRLERDVRIDPAAAERAVVAIVRHVCGLPLRSS